MEMGRKGLHACVTALYEARSCIPSHCDQKGTSLARLGKVGMNSSHLAHFFCSATQAEPVGRIIGASLSSMNGDFVCIYHTYCCIFLFDPMKMAAVCEQGNIRCRKLQMTW